MIILFFNFFFYLIKSTQTNFSTVIIREFDTDDAPFDSEQRSNAIKWM